MSETITTKDDVRMVLIPEGSFTFGAKDAQLLELFKGDQDLVHRARTEFFEIEERQVDLEAFYIDIFPITNSQYQRFLQETGYRKQLPYFDHPRLGARDHPVVGLKWEDALEYSKWAGKQLPTEEQWEKAARGTDGRLFPWGNALEPSRCNCAEVGWGSTSPMGKFSQGHSPYGVQDMAGNVWEMTLGQWTRECKTMRGGCYLTYLPFCRTTMRWAPAPEELEQGASWLGFRCIMSVQK